MILHYGSKNRNSANLNPLHFFGYHCKLKPKAFYLCRCSNKKQQLAPASRPVSRRYLFQISCKHPQKNKQQNSLMSTFIPREVNINFATMKPIFCF